MIIINKNKVNNLINNLTVKLNVFRLIAIT